MVGTADAHAARASVSIAEALCSQQATGGLAKRLLTRDGLNRLWSRFVRASSKIVGTLL